MNVALNAPFGEKHEVVIALRNGISTTTVTINKIVADLAENQLKLSLEIQEERIGEIRGLIRESCQNDGLLHKIRSYLELVQNLFKRV